MPVAIHTRYIPATDTRGSRIKAMTHRGFSEGRAVIWSVTVPYDHSGREHEQAAEALRDKHWPGKPLLYVGSSMDGGSVFAIDPINA